MIEGDLQCSSGLEHLLPGGRGLSIDGGSAEEGAQVASAAGCDSGILEIALDDGLVEGGDISDHSVDVRIISFAAFIGIGYPDGIIIAKADRILGITYPGK